MTPTLKAVRNQYPDAEIWALIRNGCEGILSGCETVNRICLTGSSKIKGHDRHASAYKDLGTFFDLRRQQFDIAFELSGTERGRFFAVASGARKLCTNDTVRMLPKLWSNRFDLKSSFNWEFRHSVEKDFYTVNEALPLDGDIPPLVFSMKLTKPCNLSNLKDFAIIHPNTRWERKKWPFKKWEELGKKLLDRYKHIIVSCGPDIHEREESKLLVERLGSNSISTLGNLDWNQLAGLMYQARVFIGVDTAAMHLSAACQCPTIALFCDAKNEPWACQWTPWKTEHRLARVYEKDINPLYVYNLAQEISS